MTHKGRCALENNRRRILKILTSTKFAETREYETRVSGEASLHAL